MNHNHQGHIVCTSQQKITAAALPAASQQHDKVSDLNYLGL